MQVGESALHEALPDQRGERAAGDGFAVVLIGHRPHLIWVADPDRRHQLRRVADEPGVAVVLRRTRLAGRGAPAREHRCLAGPVLDHVLKQRGDQRSVLLRQGLDRPGRVVVDAPNATEVDDLHLLLGLDGVLRLEVAEEEVPAVQVPEGGEDLEHEGDGLGNGDRLAGRVGVLLADLLERLAADVLHDDVAEAAVLHEVVDLDDVRVLHLGQEPPLGDG